MTAPAADHGWMSAEGRRALRDGLLAGAAVALLLSLRLYFLYDLTRHHQVELVRAELVELAQIGAAQVDGDLVHELRSPDQTGGAVHLQLLAPLVRFHRASRDLMYVYIAVQDGRDVRLVAGTDYLYRVPGDTLPVDPILSVMPTPDQELRNALATHAVTVDAGVVADAHRSYMSAYAPFKDSHGRFVGVVAVDLWVHDLEARLAELKQLALTGGVYGLVVSLLIGIAVAIASLKLRRAWHSERALNAELREAAVRAEAAAGAKDDFLASMSHEIRTPINGILGMVDMLLNSPLSDAQREYARTASHSARLLLAILGDVLDLTKSGAGRMTLQPEPFDLKAALEASAALIRAPAERRGIAVTASFPADAPRCFVGDGTRIEQILLNLGSNAEKFTARGSIELAAEVTPLAADRYRITLHVRDTGIGIPAEAHERIFERFTQLDASSARRAGGTGLGLAICRTLVELMGGRIGVDSEPGRGSHFWCEIELPAAPAPAPAVPAGNGRPGAQPAPGGAARRVLVVDDNAVNRTVAVMMLRRLGYEVEEVDGGEAAVQAVASGRYAFVFMDCEMPDVDGYEATRRIRAAEALGQPRCVISAMTANALAGDREWCLMAGMDDYLAKPVTAAALAAVLDRWLGADAARLVDPGL